MHRVGGLWVGGGWGGVRWVGGWVGGWVGWWGAEATVRCWRWGWDGGWAGRFMVASACPAWAQTRVTREFECGNSVASPVPYLSSRAGRRRRARRGPWPGSKSAAAFSEKTGHVRSHDGQAWLWPGQSRRAVAVPLASIVLLAWEGEEGLSVVVIGR